MLSTLPDVRMAIMTNNPRVLFAVATAAAVLFVLALIGQYPDHGAKVTAALSNTADKAWHFSGEDTDQIAKAKGMNKVAHHSYMNEKRFIAIRKKWAKML